MTASKLLNIDTLVLELENEARDLRCSVMAAKILWRNGEHEAAGYSINLAHTRASKCRSLSIRVQHLTKTRTVKP